MDGFGGQVHRGHGRAQPPGTACPFQAPFWELVTFPNDPEAQNRPTPALQGTDLLEILASLLK